MWKQGKAGHWSQDGSTLPNGGTRKVHTFLIRKAPCEDRILTHAPAVGDVRFHRLSRVCSVTIAIVFWPGAGTI